MYLAGNPRRRASFGLNALLTLTLLPMITATVTGCKTPAQFKEKADLEVYRILEVKSPAVPGMVDDLNIEPVEPRILDEFPVNENLNEYLGAEAEGEIGSAIITLDEALEIAFTQNRGYKSRKEQLYLQALSLTLDRHQFDPIFSARDIVDLTQVSDESTEVSGSGSVGVGRLLRGGGRLALNLTTSFTEWLRGGNGFESLSSVLSGSFSQPLLRGAGRDVNTEFLTQSERNVLYELRSFTRFRKSFAVSVVESYYGVLQARDTVENNYDNLKSSQTSFDRERAWQEEGERTASAVARLESQVLGAQAGWTRSIVGYKRSLDNFKILLGFPTDASLILDDAELTALEQRDIQLPELGTEEAIEIALVTRLDLQTDQDRVDDAFRQIKVAANGLKGGLGLLFTGSVPTKGRNRPASFDFENSVWTAGVDLDLPLDRKAERNSYRRALINYEVSKRSADLATDNVKLQVRNAWRTLEQAQTDYEINLLLVGVEESRVEEISIKAEEGIGGTTINDQVDAQNALTSAKTSLTGALVQHTISLLELWRDVGVLYVEKNGQWEENPDV